MTLIMITHGTRSSRTGFDTTGPFNLSSLPYYKSFGHYSMKLVEGEIMDGRGNCSKRQIPDIAFSLLKRKGNCYDKHWSKKLVKRLVDAALKRFNFSPKDYPFCVKDFYTAFNMYPVSSKKVLVAGSISPWNEAILIAYNASTVTTSEYSAITSSDKRIHVVNASTHFDDAKYHNYYDAVCSFSSIEHDGLGRYGDPINPNGDFAAMHEFNYVLKEGGLLYLGIPVSKTGSIVGNFQRTYSIERVTALFNQSKFVWLKTIDWHWGQFRPGLGYKDRGWQNQPIFILQKQGDI
eukprot:CAMPEP_0119036016 /NCGR_PEP_ID=MMETSP1177-20130426/3380_1 /TAXON_ID=2985 /ORGANISM="Ochromonas sp, Strain CCMP1899" /LENGTH=291 /DNA_ID=CAMNT_0006995117 /DNA_START=206 /DNA_END=1084 /DNA_ORIENTATION=-